jgi:large subunit ribosomal protein L23
MNPYEVLIRPLLSEKSNGLREKSNQYTFHVHRGATKVDVKQALEKLFQVKVLSVRTNITRGKIKRRGNNMTKRPQNHKKAVINLAEGQTIKLFEDL